MTQHWLLRSSAFVTAATVLCGAGLATGRASAEGAIPDDLENLYAQQIVEAEAKANTGQFTEALQLSEGVPVNSKHHSSIHEKQEMWAKLLLQQARDVSQRGEPQKAAALLRPLASRPSFASEAQTLSAQWQRQAGLLADLESAAENQDWAEVLASIETIRTTDADLAKTPKIQEINEQVAKSLTTPVQSTFSSKMAITPARFVEDSIGLESSIRPIKVEVASTAINLSAFEQQITPRPLPMPQPVPASVARIAAEDSFGQDPISPAPATLSNHTIPEPQLTLQTETPSISTSTIPMESIASVQKTAKVPVPAIMQG